MKYILNQNLLDQNGIICHQVNCQGVMGGLAGQIKRAFPQACTEYVAECSTGNLKCGDLLVCWDYTNAYNKAKIVAHIVGQRFPGKNTSYIAVKESFSKLKYYLQGSEEAGVKREVYIPFMMGCGMGGGNWIAYINLVASQIPDVNVVVLPEDMKLYKKHI